MNLNDISSELTVNSLRRFLQEEHGPDTDLIRYNITAGSAKGDSYLSCVHRIEVEGESKVNKKKITLHLIAKSLPASIGRRKTFRSVDFFRNEVAFYNKVVPTFMTFQKKQKPKNPFTEFPRCFLAFADGEHDTVVMEDVSYKNLKPLSRQDGLKFEQCALIMQLLGRFHGLSLAMKDKEPEVFKQVASELYETYYKPEIKVWYGDQLQLFTEIAIDAVTKELPEKIYEEKLQYFTSNSCYERMCEFVKPKEPYAVISHGDAWAPNFLIRPTNSEEGSKNKIAEVCMIDYQLARYSSCVLDISFFLYSCASEDVIFNHFDDVLGAYYKSLSDFISDLGSSPDVLFPYQEFRKEIISYFAFGLGMALESVPLSIIDDEDAPDLESITGDEAVPLTKIWALKPIKSKDGRMRLANIVKHAVDNGFV